MPVAEAPVPPHPPAEQFYSPGRVWDTFGHWICCLADNQLPSSCGTEAFRERDAAGHRKRETADTRSMHASVLKSDLEEAWRQMGDSQSPHYKLGLARYIPAVMYIGPRPWAQNAQEWDARCLDWFIVNRWRFGPLPAERYRALTNDAVRQVSHILGWRP